MHNLIFQTCSWPHHLDLKHLLNHSFSPFILSPLEAPLMILAKMELHSHFNLAKLLRVFLVTLISNLCTLHTVLEVTCYFKPFLCVKDVNIFLRMFPCLSTVNYLFEGLRKCLFEIWSLRKIMLPYGSFCLYGRRQWW